MSRKSRVLVTSAVNSGDDRAQQEAPGWRVSEQCRDEVAVVIDGRGRADERHDAVGARELEQRVDVIVAQAVRDAAQEQLPAQLGAKALAPSSFVNRQTLCVQLVG